MIKKDLITIKDKEKERFSYTKLDTYNTCPMQFKLKYEDKKRAKISTLAMDIGTILHKAKELIAEALIKGEKPDYDYIKQVVLDGYDEINEDKKDKKGKHLLGTKELSKKYFDQWVAIDEKSGMNYPQKLELFFNNLESMEKDEVWKPVAVELPFDFPYKEYMLSGFIDKIEQNEEGEIKVTDYKSSRSTYDDTKLKTPLQMFIYSMAVEHIYGELPTEFSYDFVLLNKQQEACSKGYYKRGLNKLDKLLSAIEESRKTQIYAPKPSPLCYWCDYCKTNPNADSTYKHECPYHSLWTPTNKTYQVSKPFDPSGTSKPVFRF